VCENISESSCQALELAWTGGRSVISGNGRFVAYEADGVEGTAIVRYDRQNEVTRVVSVSPAVGAQPHGECGWGEGFEYRKSYPSISNDGAVIAFAVECEGWYYAIADLEAGTIEQVLDQGEAPFDGRSVLSGNGRYLFFPIDVTGELARFDRENPGITYPLRAASGTPAVSWIAVDDDGNTIAFTSDAQLLPDRDDDDRSDVYVIRDGVLHLASQPYGVGGDSGRSWDPAISGDGNTVTFTSDSRLVPDDDQDSDWDVYVHSLLDVVF